MKKIINKIFAEGKSEQAENAGHAFIKFVITSYSIHYTKLYERIVNVLAKTS